jgi:hypothetical protein
MTGSSLAGSAAGSSVISSVAAGAGSSVAASSVAASVAGSSAGVVTDESEPYIPDPPDGCGAGEQPESTTNAAIKTAQLNTD